MKQPTWVIVAGGAAVALAAWYVLRDDFAHQERGGGRHLAPSAVRGAALDNSLGQVTPAHLIFFGPTMRPPHWVPHRVKYPASPGRELERLIYGTPGACAVAVPRDQRGWLFAPPAEVDY